LTVSSACNADATRSDPICLSSAYIIYIYIERERERESARASERPAYIYIYIERERERERDQQLPQHLHLCACLRQHLLCVLQLLLYTFLPVRVSAVLSGA
jgi:hypothetical protein